MIDQLFLKQTPNLYLNFWVLFNKHLVKHHVFRRIYKQLLWCAPILAKGNNNICWSGYFRNSLTINTRYCSTCKKTCIGILMISPWSVTENDHLPKTKLNVNLGIVRLTCDDFSILFLWPSSICTQMGRERVQCKVVHAQDRNFCSRTKSEALGHFKAMVCKINLLSLKVNQDWIGRLHIKFTVAEYTGDINDLQLHLLNTAVYRRAYSLHIVGLVQFYLLHYNSLLNNVTQLVPWGQSQHWCGTFSVKSVNVVLLLMPNRRWCMNSLAFSSCVRWLM